MRLDFNMLWVEDQPANVVDQQERIETLLRKEGFKLQVKFAKSVDEAQSFLSDEVYGDNIDLVLMDYDLGASKSGDEGLEVVREDLPYKDLIFYSALPIANLSQMVSTKNIEGVFTAHRSDLPDVVYGVFENLVKKVLDIDHSRGIVMGATSDIDYIIFNNLKEIFESCNQEDKYQIISEIHDRLDDKSKNFNKKIETIKGVQTVSELENHHSIYTSDDRLRLLMKLMKKFSLSSEHRVDFEKYRTQIMPKRNDLAHMRVEKNGFQRTFYDRNGNQILSDDMKTIRVELLQFQEILDEAFD